MSDYQTLHVDTIHLVHAGEGNMKIYSPKSIIFYSWVNKYSYFPHQHAINV